MENEKLYNPMVEITLYQNNVKIVQIGKLQITYGFNLVSSYYNIAVMKWEPIIEPMVFVMDFSYNPRGQPLVSLVMQCPNPANIL